MLDSGVKTIKLLDRSFNAKTAHALAILEFIFKHYRPGIQFQFEINGDVLDQRIIDYINDYAPRGLLRFEIGIQSTYEPTNEIVKRYQNFERLSEVIKQLQQNHKIDFHLDLIAGLPLENLERFARSFDDVFAFYPKELQLGFLKLLRGTSLRKEAEKYGIISASEPPYSMVNRSEEELMRWCYSQNIANMTYGSLGAGILTGAIRELPKFDENDWRLTFYDFFKEPKFSKVMKLLKVLDEIAAGHNAPVAQVAVNWNAQKDFVQTALCGVRNEHEANENCRGFEWSLSEEEMAVIDKAIEEYL